jgi:hypothetical protein
MPIHAGNMIKIDGDVGLFMYVLSYHAYYPDLKRTEIRDSYERKVLHLLHQIRLNRSGQALLAAIINPITIAPLRNASTTGASLSDFDRLKGNPKGTRIRVRRVGRDYVIDEHGDRYLVATGGGSAATIEFTPDTWIAGSPIDAAKKYRITMRDGSDPNAGHAPDQVLFHELAHAVRAGHGRSRSLVPMSEHWENEEEFCAILLTNIYSSETGRTMLQYHASSERMSDAAARPTLFYDRYAEQVARCVKDIPALSRRMADIDCPFNPIREHFVYSMPWLGPVLHRQRRPAS